MKIRLALIASLLLPFAGVAQDAQKSATQVTPKSLASTLDVYVFPKEGQDSSTQSKDESTCYDWAVSNSGVDPFAAQKQQQANEAQANAGMQSAQQAGAGAGARGAVGGAAVGALIGAVADGDAGKGALWGAGLGLIHGRREKREAQQEAAANTAAQYQSSTAVTAADMDNFKKAFSVCLEAKNYMVKY